MDQIEEIKARVDIVDLIGEYVTLKKAGRNFKALCPFHHEKTPSFTVSPELQMFKCFGCGASGDVIKFLQLYEQMDFWEAVEFLAKRTGVKLRRGQRYNPQEAIRRQIYALNQVASQFSHFLLVRHPLGEPARRYLQKRNIKAATIEKFQLGFSPLQGTALTQYLLKKKNFSPQQLQQSGIFFQLQRSVNGYQLFDRFHGRLVFPLYDHRGNIASFSGRIIPGLLKDEDSRGKYINGPETAAYHKSQHLFGLYFSHDFIRQKKNVILLEGEFDYLSSWQAGVRNLAAIKGTALTLEQIKLLRRFANQLKLALDADFAGNQAALKSINIAENEGLEVNVVILPQPFKDPDEFAQKNPRRWRTAVRKPIPVWDFVIKSALKRFGQQTPQAKKNILAATLPFIQQIGNEVIRLDYYRKLALTLETDVEAIAIEANKQISPPSAPNRQPISTAATIDRPALVENYLLALIILSKHPRRHHFRPLTFFAKRVYNQLQNYLQSKPQNKLAAAEFIKTIPTELQDKLRELLLHWSENLPSDIGKEIKRTKQELEKMRLRQKLQDLGQEIAQAEKNPQKDIRLLEKKFQKISGRLIALEKRK